MNSNRKILCGAAALVVSAGFFGAAFLIPGLSDHINRLGNGNLLVYGAMLLLFCLVFLGGMLLTERWEPGTWMRRKNKKVNKSLRKESKVVQTKKQYGDFSLTALSFASISIFSG